jgi:hypothetical protein
MAKQNLHTLELRAAIFAGARATGQGSEALFTAVVGNPARALSFLWHPLPGLYPIRIGTEPVGGHRGYSMDTLGRRTGRSASSAGVAGQLGFARLPGATILSGWSTRPAAKRPFKASTGCCTLGAKPTIAGCRTTGQSLGTAPQAMQRQAKPEAVAKRVCG